MNTTSEPVITVATITAAVSAIIALLVAFGLDLSDDQRNAILGVVAVAAPIIAGALARGYVTPVSKAERSIDTAFAADPDTSAKPTL